MQPAHSGGGAAWLKPVTYAALNIASSTVSAGRLVARAGAARLRAQGRLPAEIVNATRIQAHPAEPALSRARASCLPTRRCSAHTASSAKRAGCRHRCGVGMRPPPATAHACARCLSPLHLLPHAPACAAACLRDFPSLCTRPPHRFTCALTWVHTVFTLVGMRLFLAAGLFEKKELPQAEMLPLAAAFVGYIVMSNLSLNINPISFYQIMKIAIAPTVLALELVLYGKVRCMMQPYRCLARRRRCLRMSAATLGTRVMWGMIEPRPVLPGLQTYTRTGANAADDCERGGGVRGCGNRHDQRHADGVQHDRPAGWACSDAVHRHVSGEQPPQLRPAAQRSLCAWGRQPTGTAARPAKHELKACSCTSPPPSAARMHPRCDRFGLARSRSSSAQAATSCCTSTRRWQRCCWVCWSRSLSQRGCLGRRRPTPLAPLGTAPSWGTVTPRQRSRSSRSARCSVSQ